MKPYSWWKTAINVTYFCVWARACMRVRRRVWRVSERVGAWHIDILSSVPLWLHHIFWNFFHKRHDYQKNFIEHKMCVLIFSANLSETFPILRINQRDIVINVKTFSCKVPVILVGFKWDLNFVDRVSREDKILNFIKFNPVGDKLLHAGGRMNGRTEGQTDMTKLTVSFRNYSNAPKKGTDSKSDYFKKKHVMITFLTRLCLTKNRKRQTQTQRKRVFTMFSILL